MEFKKIYDNILKQHDAMPDNDTNISESRCCQFVQQNPQVIGMDINEVYSKFMKANPDLKAAVSSMQTVKLFCAENHQIAIQIDQLKKMIIQQIKYQINRCIQKINSSEEQEGYGI